MAGRNRIAKWILGILVGFIVVVVVGVAIINMEDNSNLKRSEASAGEAELTRKLLDERHDLKVQFVNMTIGKIAASDLELCYMAGYPYNRGTYNDLSRRQVAGCDAILKHVSKIEARDKAEKQRKDSAYNRAHPVK